MVDSTIQIFWWLIVDGSAAEQHSSERFMAGGCRWWTAQFKVYLLIVDGSAVEQHSSEGLWLVAVDGGQHNSDILVADCRW